MADANQREVVDAVAGTQRQQAYQRKYPEMLELETKELLTINVDIPTVYAVATGVMNRVRPYLEEIKALPKIKRELVENAEDYLLALGHATGLLRAAEVPVAELPAHYEVLLEERKLLLSDCQALEQRGLLPGDKLRELRGPISHTDTAFDIIALVMIVRGVWSNIQGKTGLTLADLERAETAADRLLAAVGERAMAGEQQTVAALNRQRAFTLFARGYDELRRGMMYLRWHEGDVDELIPSLYSNKVGRRRRSEGRSEGEPATLGSDGLSTTPGGAEVPATPPTNGTPASELPVGHPDASPFVNG